MPVRVRFARVGLCLLGLLAGCDAPSTIRAFEAAAQRAADRAAPGTMEVIDSQSRFPQSGGRTVRLRYQSEGYEFVVAITIARATEDGPPRCVGDASADCVALLRAQIAHARHTIEISRHLDPAFAACDLAFADTETQFGGAARPILRRSGGSPPALSFEARMAEPMPPIPQGVTDPVRRAERCTRGLRVRLAISPGDGSSLAAAYLFPPEHALPEPVGLDPPPGVVVGMPHYRVDLRSGRDDVVVELVLPFYWRMALELRWRHVANDALVRLGMTGRQGVAGTVEPAPEVASADRTVLRAHVLIAETSPGTPIDSAAIGADGIRIEHDLTTDTTHVLCLVRGVRRRPTAPDAPPGLRWERDRKRTAMPCDGPYAVPVPSAERRVP